MAELVNCKSCDQEIILGRSAAGPNTRIALDPKPEPDGNVDLAFDGFATVISSRRIADHKVKGFPLYRRHECGGGR